MDMASTEYTAHPQAEGDTQDNAQGNFPDDYDSTSSGGYGSSANVWSQKAQRGFDNTAPAYMSAASAAAAAAPSTPNSQEKTRAAPKSENETGLVDQSLSGGDLKGEVKDVMQRREDGEDNQIL